MRFFKTSDLLEYSNNLMPLIGLGTQKNQYIINFLDLVRKRAKDKVEKINGAAIKEGLHVSPSGLSELVFITSPVDKSRIERAFLVLSKVGLDALHVKVKNSDTILNIPLSKVKPALRTLTAVKKFDVDAMRWTMYCIKCLQIFIKSSSRQNGKVTSIGLHTPLM